MVFLKSFFKSLVVVSFVTMIVGFTVHARVDGTEVDINKLVIDPQPTIIYDTNGNQLAKFIQERKDVTAYEDIPSEIEHALLATEDREFYEHVGINPQAILRAVIHDIKVRSFEQGGSTITQQLVKNIYLTSGKTIDRKMKEAIYATVVEEELSKKEILTYYLNHTDFVYNSFGVQNAVETYFGQSLEEFKEDERVERVAKSALLMGMLQSPSQYNPFLNPDQALNRRNVVIHNMLVENYITKEEYDQAIALPLLVLDSPKYVHDGEEMFYPEIVSYVLEEIRKQYNLETVEEAKYIGMNIYTSFDPKVYEILRKHMENAELYPADAPDGAQVQSAVTIVNPKNGEIIALSGGRQAPGFLEMNRSYQGNFQPGSTFKPIIAYAPALESGKFTPDTSVPANSGMLFGRDYVVRNFAGENYGNVSVTQALTLSANTSAVHLLQKTGIKEATKFAAKQGVVLGEEDKYLPIALGALSIGVDPTDMADAYQGFSNGGYRIPAHMIRQIVAHDGTVEYEAPQKLTEEFRTMKKDTAKYMKYMLRNGVENGTGANAKIEGQFVAGKTGTAELAGNRGRNRDIWFTGFTNTFVASVWMGYDSPNEQRSFSNQNTSWIAARMFSEFGKELAILYPSPLENYEKPKELKPEVEQINLQGKYSEEDKKVLLWWDEMDDVVYKIYRNGELLHETDWHTFENITIKAGQEYTYQVKAYDAYTDEEIGVSKTLTLSTASVKEEAEEEVEETESTEEQPESNDEDNEEEKQEVEENATEETVE